MVLSAPLGPAHAENGYPSSLRAHHLSLGADREVETSRRFRSRHKYNYKLRSKM